MYLEINKEIGMATLKHDENVVGTLKFDTCYSTEEQSNENISAIMFKSNDLYKKITVKDFLKKLLITLWEEGEGFSGKRPFGNSEWKYDMYAELIKRGIIEGRLDKYENKYIEELDEKVADKFVIDFIKKL